MAGKGGNAEFVLRTRDAACLAIAVIAAEGARAYAKSRLTRDDQEHFFFVMGLVGILTVSISAARVHNNLLVDAGVVLLIMAAVALIQIIWPEH